MAAEYAPDILAGLLDRQVLRPRPGYMDDQADINGRMRAILIDWLVDVHQRYHLRRETLFLAVNIIDRYLSIRPLARRRLQLLGVVAMFIAAKFEEIDPPRAHEFSYITDNTYDRREILNMEATVLKALDFQVAVSTPAHFISHMHRANNCDGLHSALALYALELSLLDLRSLQHKPSELVGASLLLSNVILGRRLVWPEALANCTQQTEASMLARAEEIRGLMAAAPTATLQAIQRKYRLEQRFAVSTLRVPGPEVLSTLAA